MVNVCVQHFDFHQLPNSKLTNANILCLVRFRREQISAVTASVPEQWQPDRTITSIYMGESLQKICYMQGNNIRGRAH